MNYLLINDRRPEINEADVFDIDGNLNPEGRQILINNTLSPTTPVATGISPNSFRPLTRSLVVPQVHLLLR